MTTVKEATSAFYVSQMGLMPPEIQDGGKETSSIFSLPCLVSTYCDIVRCDDDGNDNEDDDDVDGDGGGDDDVYDNGKGDDNVDEL